MKKLKIAIFEPSRVFWGGGQKEMANTAAYLSSKHDVTVFTQRVPDKKLDFGKCKFRYIKPHQRYLAPFAFMRYKLKKQEGFDVIVYGCFPGTLAALKNSDYPSVHISHAPPRFFYDLKEHMLKNSDLLGKLKVHVKNIFFKRFEQKAIKKITKILGISKEIQKRVRKYYGRSSGIFYAGVDPKKYKEGKYENYILSVCRIVSAKRPDLIVKSMEYVKNKDIKIVLVGAGDMDKKIAEMAKKYPNIIIKGFVSDKELSKLYSNCLAVVYVPINEDMGYVPMEAGACAKATIGVNEGGLKDLIIEGKTGFLIDKITQKKLAEKIDYLANNKKNAVKMGKAAKKFTKRFHLKNTFAVLDKAIEEAIRIKKK